MNSLWFEGISSKFVVNLSAEYMISPSLNPCKLTVAATSFERSSTSLLLTFFCLVLTWFHFHVMVPPCAGKDTKQLIPVYLPHIILFCWLCIPLNLPLFWYWDTLAYCSSYSCWSWIIFALRNFSSSNAILETNTAHWWTAWMYSWCTVHSYSVFFFMPYLMIPNTLIL